MNIDDYVVVVTPLSADDGGGFMATIPDLPGCMGDGETAEDAVTDVRLAAIAWIEAASEMERDIPAPGSAVERMMKRDEAMTKALQALIQYAELADNQIDQLEKHLARLVHLLEDDALPFPAAALIARTSARESCH